MSEQMNNQMEGLTGRRMNESNLRRLTMCCLTHKCTFMKLYSKIKRLLALASVLDVMIARNKRLVLDS